MVDHHFLAGPSCNYASPESGKCVAFSSQLFRNSEHYRLLFRSEAVEIAVHGKFDGGFVGTHSFIAEYYGRTGIDGEAFPFRNTEMLACHFYCLSFFNYSFNVLID